MKRLISFLVSVFLILGLAACSDPRAEFDELAPKAVEARVVAGPQQESMGFATQIIVLQV